MYRKKGRGWTKHIDFMLIDIACIVIAFFISYVIRFGFNNPYMDKDYRILGVAFLLIDFFVEIMADSFKNVLKRGYLDEFISTCKHAVLVFLVTALFLFTTQMADIYSRLSFYIMFPIYVTITYVARLALKSFLKKKGFGASKKSLFVIAPDAMLRDTLRTVEKSCIGYTKIVAASLDTDMKGKTICGIPIVANHDGIVDYACDEWVDEVLIPPCSEDEYPEKMADIFLEMGIAVHTGIAKNGTAQGGYKQIEKIGDYTVVTSSVNYANTSALLVKRGMDIVGGLVGCLFTLIIMIFVGPAIYIASPGPIFFSQERIGRNGRKFKMYKFRSMYMDAEERKKELMAQNKVGDGMMFKMDFDPRIIGNKVLPNGKKKTGIGQFIRKTSLDEFPQFFNILVGDMSLVGTRPPTLDEWENKNYHNYIQENATDIAQTVQEYTEKAVITLIKNLANKYHAEYLCLGGGLFLNCLLNQKILENCNLKEVFIFPASGDDGQAIGNAFYAYKKHFPQMPNPQIKLPYLGFSYSNSEIEDELKTWNLNYIFFEDNVLARMMAQAIFDNKIIAFHRGRTEVGPRALCHRSILANPTNPNMKDIINNRIKHRENFRPFAPVVTKEMEYEIFDLKQSSPYMLLAPTVKKRVS